MVGRLVASLGNGCRLSLAGKGAEGIAAIAPGVVVLHPDRTLAAITGEAERLLADIADPSASGRLPAAVYAAAACLCRASIVAQPCLMPLLRCGCGP